MTQKMNKNMVITGYALSKAPDFIPSLEEATGEEWGYWGLRSNIKRRGALTELYRYFLYYWFSLLIVLKCMSCKNIITTQQFYGLIVAFYSRLFQLKKRYTLTVLTFIYKPKNGFLGNVYFRFIRYIVTSKYIDAIVVYPEGEVGYYEQLFGCAPGRFHYVKLGKSDEGKSFVPVKGDYLISVGRSNRDYKWLVDAISGTGYKLFVVNDKFAEEVYDENIQPLKSCHAKEMLELMSKAFCVIVPLLDPNISAGQLVVLQGQNLHKPVIATRSAGITDYITDSETGFIINKDKGELLAILEKLKDDALYERISQAGYDSFVRNHSVGSQFRDIGNIVRSYMVS